VLPTLLSAPVFTLLPTHLILGDVLMARVGYSGFIQWGQLASLRKKLELDKSLAGQFASWSGSTARGEFGRSLRTGEPVHTNIAHALEPSVELGTLALVVAVVVAIPMGVVPAVRRHSPIDYPARFVAIGGISLPDVFVGLLVILLLSRAFGYCHLVGYVSFYRDRVTNMPQLYLLSMILGFRLAASTSRVTRDVLLEVLVSDYSRTTWAKGLRDRNVVSRHALRKG
jgi:peptide/nickel transport system permease protein